MKNKQNEKEKDKKWDALSSKNWWIQKEQVWMNKKTFDSNSNEDKLNRQKEGGERGERETTSSNRHQKLPNTLILEYK